jgi:hypothetical protein
MMSARGARSTASSACTAQPPVCAAWNEVPQPVDDHSLVREPLVGRHRRSQSGCASTPRLSHLPYVCLYHRRGARPSFLFDFDGLILDTETASRAGWQWLYQELGHELPPDKWALMVGTVDGWDIWGNLEELHGEPLDRASWNEKRYAHEVTLLDAEELRPGIADYLSFAEEHGLKRAIVSSASRRWVDMHLRRLGAPSAGTRSSPPTTSGARSRGRRFPSRHSRRSPCPQVRRGVQGLAERCGGGEGGGVYVVGSRTRSPPTLNTGASADPCSTRSPTSPPPISLRGRMTWVIAST